MDGYSKDLVKEEIEKLKSVFPQCVVEGRVKIDKLLNILGEYVEEDYERYEFTWKGKSECYKIAKERTKATLIPCQNESVNFNDTQNIYIEGDNLEVLKILQQSYYNKVKMIYIDPPYNTGNDFVYKDNYRDSLENYKKIIGEQTSSNSESNGRFHTDWLNMMFPRLMLAHTLLKDDGVIFISIDDNEVDNLKKLCNEVFGEENFVAELVWLNKEGGGSSDSKLFRIKHEYILCYAKSINNIDIFGVNITNLERYSFEDEYINLRGKYLLIKLSSSSIQYSKSLDYPIESPEGTFIMPSDNANGKRACWRWSKSKFDWGVKNGFIEIKKDIKNKWTVYSKQYINCDNEGNIVKRTQRPLGVIEQYSSTQASKLLENLGLCKIFDYSKPVDLIDYLIQRVCSNDDIVLDFFSGSATTAHAVMQLNAEDGGNRKYIMVQLPELCRENTEAYKQGYKNICEIGKERIRRAGQKIKNEIEEKNKNLKEGEEAKEVPDIGFRVFKLDSTNISRWDIGLDNINEIENLLNRKQTLVEGRNEIDAVYEILIKNGFELTENVYELDIDGYKFYHTSKENLIMICLDEDIPVGVVEKASEYLPKKFIFSRFSFEDTSKLSNINHFVGNENKIEIEFLGGN